MTHSSIKAIRLSWSRQKATLDHYSFKFSFTFCYRS